MTDETEELLRTWSGRAILNPAAAPPVPVSDPATVRDFTRRHGIDPCLGHLLSGRHEAKSEALPSPDIPHAIAIELARTHELDRVLARIHDRLPDPPLIYKGQALAHTLYPRPWLRPRGDTDVLVEHSCAAVLIREMEGLGYEKTLSTEGDLILPQVSVRRYCANIEHVWDIHWALSNRPALADFLCYEELRNAAVPVQLDEAVFHTPCPVHGLLIACLHLIGHHSNDLRLIWLYDIHLLVDSLTEPGCREFLHRASSRPDVRATCHAALALAHRYLPAARTDELRQALDPGPGARWAEESTYWSRLAEDARAVGGGNRLRFVMQHAFPGPDYMMKRFGFRQRWQLPWWYAVRIGRAIPKLFRRR